MGKKSSSAASKPLTRSDSRTKEKKVAITEPAKSSKSESAKGGEGTIRNTSSLERRKNKTNTNTNAFLTPIWIQYYIKEANDPTSDFGKGCRQPNGYFEELMDHFVGSEDNLYEVLKLNPESCIMVYADGSGTMRVIHHLTPEVHGDAIIVGLEGFGGKSSQVKLINSRHFVKPTELEPEQAVLPVPDLIDFVTLELDEIQTKDKVEPGDEAAELTTLSQILGGQPSCFLIHPKWLSIIHPTIGEPPMEMAEKIIKFGRDKVGCDDDYQGIELLQALDEFHPLLIFLWGCHNKRVIIDSLPRTYSLDNAEIAGRIINKILRMNGPVRQERTSPPDEVGKDAATEAPAPTFNRPPPLPPRLKEAEESKIPTGGGGDDSSDSDESDERDRSPKHRRSDNRKRRRKAISRSRSQSYSPHRSRSHSQSRSRSHSSRRRKSDKRRRSRSESRGRPRRHRSASPPRYHRRKAGDTDRKRKTLADKLTEEQLRAFTLLSARDWNDRTPEMSRPMERLLDQTTLSTAISMFRSESSHGKWKGDLPDSAIAQFLQQGILVIDGETTPSGFSMFFIQPKTYVSKGRNTEQMRKERLSQDFGKDGVSDEAISRLAKLEYHIPQNYEDLVVMIDTGIKWLDYCTGRRSIASRGLRAAYRYLEDYRSEIHRIIIRDPQFPIKLIHSLDRAVTYVGDKLAYTYLSISEGKYRLEGVMERRLDHHLTGIEECQHNFPSHAIPDDILSIMQEEKEPAKSTRSKSREKQSEERSPLQPRWHSTNTHAIEKWQIPKGKEFKELFGRGSEALKGWPKFDHHLTMRWILDFK